MVRFKQVYLQRAILFLLISVISVISAAGVKEVLPVLEFPEAVMDDPAKYRDYQTRFFRDTAGNSFQIYLNRGNGRVVNLAANSANESVGFSVRDTAGQPAILTWKSRGAEISSVNEIRYVEYSLSSPSPVIEIGNFMLGSMRKERDYQYYRKDQLPFGSDPFHEPELLALIDHLDRLPAEERDRQLKLLSARTTAELRARLEPKISLKQMDSRRLAQAEQVYFDGKNRLYLELITGNQFSVDMSENKILIRSRDDRSPIELSIRVGTNSPALTPLDPADIFNKDFQRFYQKAKAESKINQPKNIRYKWLEREMKGMELLSSQDKLMAGLPNFATYFGRDTIMSALMLEPVWSVSMSEHAISSVLRKISDSGQVSHEEALGGQAIRENADEYNQWIKKYSEHKSNDDQEAEASLLKARTILKNLQLVRENYRMVDDDFQFPVLVARYLRRADVPADQKRKFLQKAVQEKTSALEWMIRNLIYVRKETSSYADRPEPLNLVSFFKTDDGVWSSGSWRDSGVGYGKGRFAMDVNTIWVPNALEAVQTILNALIDIGLSTENLQAMVPELKGSRLMEYMQDPGSLNKSIEIWRQADKHFLVKLQASEIKQQLKAKLDWLPEGERLYWQKMLSQTDADDRDFEFLALSLDENGQPIPVVNTDPATRLFLESFVERQSLDEAVKLVDAFVRPYPVGLFVDGLGPLVANDAYASSQVWENFKDEYHSPRVVWGREVNLFLLGVGNQILASTDMEGKARIGNMLPYITALQAALKQTLTAVEASGLKHNELWTYRIEEGKLLLPVRYPTSTDIQLWNLTDLAVQFLLESLPQGARPHD